MLVQMTKQNLDNFKGVVPERIIYKLSEDENYYGIGIVPNDKSLPVASLVFNVDMEKDDEGTDHVISELQWLYVDEEMRENGAATFLFDEYLNLLDGSEVEAIKTYLSLDTKYNLICGMLENFGFSFDLVERFEFEKPLGEIKESRLLRGKVESDDIFPLSHIRSGFFANGLIAMSRMVDMEDYLLPTEISAYDADVSMVYMPNHELKGYLLVRKLEPEVLDIIFLKCVGPNSSSILRDMLRSAVIACNKKYDNNLIVHAHIRSESAGKLVGQLLPDERSRVMRRGYFTI